MSNGKFVLDLTNNFSSTKHNTLFLSIFMCCEYYNNCIVSFHNKKIRIKIYKNSQTFRYKVLIVILFEKLRHLMLKN